MEGKAKGDKRRCGGRQKENRTERERERGAAEGTKGTEGSQNGERRGGATGSGHGLSLKVTNSHNIYNLPKTVPACGDQICKHMSLYGAFHFQTIIPSFFQMWICHFFHV